MMEYCTASGKAGTPKLAEDCRTLAFNVLLRVGFGKFSDFMRPSDRSENPLINDANTPMDYRDALATILQNIMLVLAFGPNLLAKIPFPRKLAQLGDATQVFKSYMTDMYQHACEEATSRDANGEIDNNLLTSLVNAASMETGRLNKDEVIGNMFVYNFAGHDTTAHTLAMTFMLLAAYPEVQDWMHEEIVHVLGQESDSAMWDYDASFPRLKRCLAVLVRRTTICKLLTFES
jgi:cytochrome P450